MAYSSSKNTGLDIAGWYLYNICNGGRTSEPGPASGRAGYGTHEVGKKAANSLGIYDMSGNVWEWCYDWFGSDTGSGSVTDPAGVDSGSYRVLRGGSWDYSADGSSVSRRSGRTPSYRSCIMGIRLVRSAK